MLAVCKNMLRVARVSGRIRAFQRYHLEFLTIVLSCSVKKFPGGAKNSVLMPKKEATYVLREKLGRTITFWAAKIEKKIFYKKWAIFVAA